MNKALMTDPNSVITACLYVLVQITTGSLGMCSTAQRSTKEWQCSESKAPFWFESSKCSIISHQNKGRRVLLPPPSVFCLTSRISKCLCKTQYLQWWKFPLILNVPRIAPKELIVRSPKGTLCHMPTSPHFQI